MFCVIFVKLIISFFLKIFSLLELFKVKYLTFSLPPQLQSVIKTERTVGRFRKNDQNGTRKNAA